MKLWHLWLGTPCCYSRLRWMAPVSSRHQSPSYHHHQSQKSIIHKRPLETIPLTSLLVTVFTGLWYPLAGHARYMDGPCWHPFPKRPHWHHQWQCWCHHYPWSSSHPGPWPCPHTPYQVLLLLRPPCSKSDWSCTGWLPSILLLSPHWLDLWGWPSLLKGLNVHATISPLLLCFLFAWIPYLGTCGTFSHQSHCWVQHLVA